jgi:hypothetical protein
MYNEYLKFVSSIADLSTSAFKSNTQYNEILEHVTKKQGEEYLILINRFPEVTVENIKEFVRLNDKYGYPEKHIFTFSDGSIMACSATSLRYVYHSLLILSYYKLKSTSKNIVEVGCGYGGLFLGICYFANILNISIDHYYFVDLPEICILIRSYLKLHNDIININYTIHSATNYGSDINNKDLFLISNYCFTEIEKQHRDKYVALLFPKVINGFIIWQTLFGLPISDFTIINKQIVKIVEEEPQTASLEKKNYFLYF